MESAVGTKETGKGAETREKETRIARKTEKEDTKKTETATKTENQKQGIDLEMDAKTGTKKSLKE